MRDIEELANIAAECPTCRLVLRASPNCGRVYREKVRARKNEVIENVLIRK